MHLCFQFSYSTFSRYEYCLLSALNRRAAAKSCGNKFCFCFCVCAFWCGDEIDGILSEYACHLHFSFKFSSSTFFVLVIALFGAQNQPVAFKVFEIACCFGFCVWVFVRVMVVLTGGYLRQHVICTSAFSFCFRLFTLLVFAH